MKKFQIILPLLLTACFLLPSTARAAYCKSTDVIPIDVPDTVCVSSVTPCPSGYAATTGATCDSGSVCCTKTSSPPKTSSSPTIGTKFLCEYNAGHCAAGLGCDGSKYESAIGSCEGGVSCCRFDPALESAAKAAAATTADCVSKGGHCASGSGCNGNAPYFESAIGTCTGGASCCKKDPTLEAAAKAAAKPTPGPLSLPNPLGNADLPVLIGRVISTFLGLVGAISLVVFVFAGVRYMTAGGREEAVKQAKDAMKYAFIGITIILFAYIITNFFFQTLLK